MLFDTRTNKVVTYTKPNRASGRLSWVREEAIDLPWRNPAEVDPLLMEAARHDPVMRSEHKGQVRDMLVHLLSYYRPDVTQHPQFVEEMSDIAAAIHSSQEVLATLPDARSRWNVILSALVPKPSKKVTKGKRKTKRSKITI